jgi:hypothetical protein
MNEPREQTQSNASTRLRKIRQRLLAEAQELASLAARICPELCQKNPSRAVKIAQALLDEAWTEIAEPLKGSIYWAAMAVEMESAKEELEKRGAVDKEAILERLKKTWWARASGSEKAWLAAVRSGTWTEIIDGILPREVAEDLERRVRPFEYGVKSITGQKRLDRAMPWFRKFIGSRTPSEQACNIEIAKARKDGFIAAQMHRLTSDFFDWKAKEKSRIAKIKSSKRKKKGQV